MKTVIARGIHRAVWPGRMEILSTEPFLMVDGAHNSNGIHALRTSLEELYPEEKFHFVMGVMADKDYEKMIGELLPIAMDFVTVTPESARALQGETLAEDIRKQGVPAHAITKVAEIPELLTPKEKTIALGSLYFIGELKAYIRIGHNRCRSIHMALQYETTKEHTITVTGYEGTIRHLVIPDQVDGCPVKTIGKMHFPQGKI